MTTNKPKTIWWVEPNRMPGAHNIRASVRYMSGRTIEVSRLVHHTEIDSAIVPQLLVGQIISSMQSELKVYRNDNVDVFDTSEQASD